MKIYDKVTLLARANRKIGTATARQFSRMAPLKLDVTVTATCVSAAKGMADGYGRVDILIDIAGVAAVDELFTPQRISTPGQDLETAFDANLFAAITVTQAILPVIGKRPALWTVNVTGIFGSITLEAHPESSIKATNARTLNISESTINAFAVQLAATHRRSIELHQTDAGWAKLDAENDRASIEIVESANTSERLASSSSDGSCGWFIHLGHQPP